MKKTLLAMTAAAAMAAPAMADVKIGIALGFTGPAESLANHMAQGAELAAAEISDSGVFMGGASVETVRGDSTCTDAGAATATADRLINAEGVDALFGGLCSGATIAMLQNVSMPNGVLQFSPSATSPALTTLEDNNLFFRASPSDARQGQVIAEMLQEKGFDSIALTYTNNDYGKGLADSIQSNFEGLGGEVTITAAHEDGKADYGAEVGALAQAGGDILVVVGYLDQGGKGIIQSSLDAGAYDQFFLPDAMIGDSLVEAIGPDLNGSIGTVPGTDSDGARIFGELAKMAGNANGPYAPESYDAMAMLLFAMHKTGGTDAQELSSVMYEIANAPGEQILPGDLARGLEILAAGGDIDYVGATALELIEPGESAGSYAEILVEDGQNKVQGYR